MSEWKEYKLKDITTKIGSGATPRGGKDAYFSSGITLIRSLNIYDFKFESKALAFINELQAKKLNNVTVEENDILLNITGASVGRCTIVPKNLLPARVNQHVSIIRLKQGIANPRFLLYSINSRYYKELLLSIAYTGATREALTKSDIENFKLLLPPLPIQRRIAAILSAYDELIETNNRRIAILEQMAEQIYKEWFVRMRFPGYQKTGFVKGVPKGWEDCSLGDLVEFKKGKNITLDTITRGSVPVVAGGITPAYFHNKSNTKSPTITISASGANAGYVNLYPENIWVSDCSYLDMKGSDFVYYFYLQLKIRQVEVSLLQKGSAQPHVYPKDVMSLRTLNPGREKIKTFETLISPFFEEMKNLKQQNQNLKQTRDLLLPRLISGKLRVAAPAEVTAGKKGAEGEMKKAVFKMDKKVKLKEYIHPEMDLLFVALNAPEVSNKNEHWFSYDIKFWKRLHQAGIITKKIKDKLKGDVKVFGDTAINKNNMVIGVADLNREIVQTDSKGVITNKEQVDRILKILDNHPTKKLCLMHAEVAKRFQRQKLIKRNIENGKNNYGIVGQYNSTEIFEVPFHNASVPGAASFYKILVDDVDSNQVSKKQTD